MIGIDTNVLVRLLTNDDPDQSPRAAKLFASDDVFIPRTVLLETEWVLRFSYATAPATIHAAFVKLTETATVTVESVGAVQRALAWYQAGIDFADALHLAACSETDRFATFDRKLARSATRSKATPKVEAL